VRLLRPLPRRLASVLTVTILVAWTLQMGWLLRDASARASLSGDLARYGGSAQWKGIYYRGEKIGFSVSETVAQNDGYELREDAQLQMALLGSTSPAVILTRVRVDPSFTVRSFSFSLDPGSGPITVEGTVEGRRLTLGMGGASGKRTEVRELDETPNLSLNLSRRLAAEGLAPGKTFDLDVFDPATLRNAPMHIEVQAREVVRAADRPVPAFRVQTRFGSLTSLSWITDVGDVVREESPTGFIVVRETRAGATMRAIPGSVQQDLLETVAIKPRSKQPILDPRAVRCLRLRLEAKDLPADLDLDGVGQRLGPGGEIELYASTAEPMLPRDPDVTRYLQPEALIESDAPEIVAEAHKAVEGEHDPARHAERLTRYVHALLDKKPTVGLPSAREVLRTRVGDCNEHTALYVAMARALGLPSRVAVGLVFLRGAFYYHAWPEVYVEETPGRARWLAVDPTLDEYPADATHLRLARGGLDRQAVILPLVGRAELVVLEQTVDPAAATILVGAPRAGHANVAPAFDVPLPRRTGGRNSCWSHPD
jgi:transglutaminase-like putative cysteine protease